MPTAPSVLDTYDILTRIDAIIHELTTLRQQLEPQITTPTTTSTRKTYLSDELFGAAGQGSKDEYDLDVDWARFSA